MDEEREKVIKDIVFDKFFVVYEENQIKVKSTLTKINDEDALLDSVTRCISDSPGCFLNMHSDSFLSYWCDEKTAGSIFDELETLKIENNAIDDRPEQPEEGATGDTCILRELDDSSAMTLGELLETKLNLPSYQRPYRWGRKNIEFFWHDILESAETYDYGIIVLLKKDGDYDIVDGQQRIVTLSLMLRALSSDDADSFINNTTLQGKDSEKNIGYNLQWFRRESRKLSESESTLMIDKILNGTLDVIVMDELDDALKFFDRTNTTGVPLTPTDILKSYHLQVLSSIKELSPQAKERWKDNHFGFSPNSLDNIDEFKREVVRKWESMDPWSINGKLSQMCALRQMAEGQYAESPDYITDIEQFRKGGNKEGEYSGLDSPMADGEFFFWYVFNVNAKFDDLHKDYKVYDEKRKSKHQHAALLKSLLLNSKGKKEVGRAVEMFNILVVYIDEKYGKGNSSIIDGHQYNKVLDLIFSWLIYHCLYSDALQFAAIRNSALKEGSVFNAVIAGMSIEDCFDCYTENPYERLVEEGWGERIEGNGAKYLIRRELRRIYGEDNKNT